MHFVFDLDGTLCFDGRTIHEKILEALRSGEKRQHKVMFASARSYRDCVPLLPEDLRKKVIVGLNGAMIFEKEKLVEFKCIDREVYETAIAYCLKNGLPFFVDDIADYALYKRERILFYPFVDVLKQAKEVRPEEISRPLKLVIFINEAKNLKELYARLDEDKASLMYHDGEKTLYVNPKNTNKASAVSSLCKDFVCFGNDKNDTELFQKAGYAVMVGDYEPLKKHSDIVIKATPSTISEAIEEAFQRF